MPVPFFSCRNKLYYAIAADNDISCSLDYILPIVHDSDHQIFLDVLGERTFDCRRYIDLAILDGMTDGVAWGLSHQGECPVNQDDIRMIP